MPHTLYCYRLGASVPLLTEEEYAEIELHLRERVEALKQIRKEHNCGLAEARERMVESWKAMDVYEEITGQKLRAIDDLYAVRLSLYGRPCPACAKPFRTPRATFCAECGFELPNGEVAGPAQP